MIQQISNDKNVPPGEKEVIPIFSGGGWGAFCIPTTFLVAVLRLLVLRYVPLTPSSYRVTKSLSTDENVGNSLQSRFVDDFSSEQRQKGHSATPLNLAAKKLGISSFGGLDLSRL